MLKLENVCTGYGRLDVVHDISFSLRAGESLCILGPNGCGKSTLLRAIAGLLPFRGRITLGGKDIRRMKRGALAAKVALMSQMSAAYFPYTVQETVEMGRYQRLSHGLFGGTLSRSDRVYVEQCMKTTGLLPLRNKPITTLSGGQLQRVFLARTLAQEPSVILLDEPTNHLDLKHQVELAAYLQEWSSQREHMVIGVFHDMNLAFRLSSQALFLKDGRAAALGTPGETATPALLRKVYDMDVAGYMCESLRRWEHLSGPAGKPIQEEEL